MNRDLLKSIVGIYLIVAHASAILTVFYLRRYLELSVQFELVSIMTPVFTVHTSAVVKDFIRNQASVRSPERVNFNFVFISLFFPVILTLSLFCVLIAYPLNIIDSVDNLRRAVLGCEICFGGYLGLLTESLFHNKAQSQRKNKQGSNVRSSVGIREQGGS
jgi:hypothetical protein